jgi:hypothetical protein
MWVAIRRNVLYLFFRHDLLRKYNYGGGRHTASHDRLQLMKSGGYEHCKSASCFMPHMYIYDDDDDVNDDNE